MKDNRQKTVDWIVRRIKSGKLLTSAEERKMLYLARDYTLMDVARAAVSGQHKDAKHAAKLFNVLQPAVERYELMHPRKDGTAYTFDWEKDLPDYTYEGPEVEA